MIDCPNGDVRDVLPDYVNDRLGESRRVEVERHLGSCAACRDEVALLRDLCATMGRAPAVNVAAIAAAIPPYRAPASRGRASNWRAAAAIAAIVVGGTSIALLRDDRPTDRVGVPSQVAQTPTAGVDPTPTSTVPPVAPSGGRSAAAAAAGTRELAMAVSAIGELSDSELSVLVEGLESLEALPSTDVEGAEPLSAAAVGES